MFRQLIIKEKIKAVTDHFIQNVLIKNLNPKNYTESFRRYKVFGLGAYKFSILGCTIKTSPNSIFWNPLERVSARVDTFVLVHQLVNSSLGATCSLVGLERCFKAHKASLPNISLMRREQWCCESLVVAVFVCRKPAVRYITDAGCKSCAARPAHRFMLATRHPHSCRGTYVWLILVEFKCIFWNAAWIGKGHRSESRDQGEGSVTVKCIKREGTWPNATPPAFLV